MPDNLTPSQRKTCMSNNRGTNTKPELKLRKELWHNGFRYLVNDARLPGRPDIVLPKYRTAVFVHGCFWHGHRGCANYTIPKSNEDYWIPKISRNQQRDQEVWRQLEAKGWSVIIVWECQLKKSVIDQTIIQVKDEIIRNGRIHQKNQLDRRLAKERYEQEQHTRKAREKALKVEVTTKCKNTISQK